MEYLKEPLDPKAFEGKTISHLERVADNFLLFEFTDGTKVALESLPDSGIFNSSPALVAKDTYVIGIKHRRSDSFSYIGERVRSRHGRGWTTYFAWSWESRMRFTWEQALAEIPKWTRCEVILLRVELGDGGVTGVPVEIPKEVLAEKELRAEQQAKLAKEQQVKGLAKPSMDQRPAAK